VYLANLTAMLLRATSPVVVVHVVRKIAMLQGAFTSEELGSMPDAVKALVAVLHQHADHAQLQEEGLLVLSGVARGAGECVGVGGDAC